MAKSLKMLVTDDIYGFIKRLVSAKREKGGINIINVAKRIKLDSALEHLREKSYTKIGSLNATAYVTEEPVPFEDRFVGREIKLEVGKRWADKVFDCAWMHITGDIPKGTPKDRLVYLIDISGEGLVYDKNGTPKQGITCYASQFDYRLGLPVKKVVLDDNLSEGGRAEFFIDCGANDLFGNLKNNLEVVQMDIALVNPEIRALAYDIEVLLSVYDFNADDEYIRKLFADLKEVAAATKDINESRAAKLREKLKPYLETPATEGAFTYTAIGHAHIDLAWLWPLRETKRKGARSFCNQFVNMARYPGYKFGASQAQLYDWMAKEYPTVFENIKKAYKEGRWELQGATWVEMDSNLISGESLVRQFYYGLKYYLNEFGEHMKILWLPDSFGYSACIPQVMRLANVPYFLTQKLSWNTVNKFPYHTFKWEGLDGSTVYAHMLPENTYNGPARGDYLKAGEKNYAERKIHNEAISLFGIGDGGGGPGFEHVERANRLHDIKGMPRYNFGFAKDFFEKTFAEPDKFPHHKGELYLEKHQGTFTTWSDVKKMNRKCEFRLRNYEMLMALADGRGLELPIGRDELDQIWKEVLLYQFHDILPGSSINRVYVEAKERYEAIVSRLTWGIDKLLNKLIKGRGVANFNSFAYDLPIKVNDLWYRVRVPALGVTGLSPDKLIEKFEAKATKNSIENDKVRVTFKNGFIVSVYDKTLGKEFVRKGAKFNRFTLYKDFGNCWDIRRNYRIWKRNATCDSFETGTDGAKAYALVRYSVGNTEIKQEISILDGSPLVSFDTDIDTDSKNSMLRVAFPVNIETDECKFNIQFGHIARKTTENNSIEKAQFEVPGQKFVDMSDNECGISVINNCKYGFRCKHGVIDMNVSRSPLLGPGKDVDFGHHHFRYAIFPHKGALSYQTYRKAYLFNNPLSVITNGVKEAEEIQNYFTDNKSIILEAVKLADDGNGMIVRAYNCSDMPQTAAISIRGFKPVCFTDILENSIGDAPKGMFEFGSFELKCIRFTKEENV
ncbi:MAG TPA: glycoside hydrolase family 38 C-terminal domain-containing protein [Clostridia bacterium]|nr:glycoside hydrolase family 38 C-terminal domain-containing protein [Clostridia bacterium]